MTDQTNVDRAADIIAARHHKDQMEGDGAVGCFDTAAAVEELHAAGLIAPDLPAPNDTSLPNPTRLWVLDAEGSPVVWTAPGGRVMIQRVEPGDLTPNQARTFALNVLAAVAYAGSATTTNLEADQ